MIAPGPAALLLLLVCLLVVDTYSAFRNGRKR